MYSINQGKHCWHYGIIWHICTERQDKTQQRWQRNVATRLSCAHTHSSLYVNSDSPVSKTGTYCLGHIEEGWRRSSFSSLKTNPLGERNKHIETMLKKNSKKLTWSPHAAVAFIFYTPTVKVVSQANIFHKAQWKPRTPTCTRTYTAVCTLINVIVN